MGIWPTHRGWVVLGVGFASFVMAVVNPGLLAAAFTAGVWAMFFVSLGGALFSLHGLNLIREPGEDTRRGQWVMLPVRIINQANRTRQSLVVVEATPFTAEPVSCHVVTPLTPRETRRLPRPVFAAHRGEYALEKVLLRGGDPAGLFVRQKVFRQPESVLILPEVEQLVWLPLRPPESIRAAAAGNPLGVAGVGQDYFGVREYRPTDGAQSVDWKATARHRQLMVREFEENTVHEVSIFLDVNRRYVNRSLDNFEFQVKVAATLVEYLAGMHCQLLFSSGGGLEYRPSAGPAPTVYAEIMHALTLITPEDTDVLTQLDAALEAIPPESILYCLTLYEPKGLEEAYGVLLARGVQIRWLHAPRTLFEAWGDERKMAAVRRFVARSNRLVTPVIVNPAFDVASVLTALR